MKTESEIRAHLLEKAAADAAFRARLVADPKATVEQEFDLTFPEGLSMHVHEETDSSAHLVLPQADGKLTPGELQRIAGGDNGPSPWNNLGGT